MKVEGTPEEIRNFVQTENFEPSKFFNPVSTSIGKIWIVIPAAVFIICMVGNIFSHVTNEWALLINVVGICSACWLAFSSQLAWNQKFITGLIPVFSILILLISSSEISMAEAVEHFDKYTQDCAK